MLRLDYVDYPYDAFSEYLVCHNDHAVLITRDATEARCFMDAINSSSYVVIRGNYWIVWQKVPKNDWFEYVYKAKFDTAEDAYQYIYKAITCESSLDTSLIPSVNTSSTTSTVEEFLEVPWL